MLPISGHSAEPAERPHTNTGQWKPSYHPSAKPAANNIKAAIILCLLIPICIFRLLPTATPIPGSSTVSPNGDTGCWSDWCKKQITVVRGNYYNLTGMLYRRWFQKIVKAYNLLFNISPLSDALSLPKWHKGTRLHKTCFSHLVILSVFVSLWQILPLFYPDDVDS